MKNRKNVYVMLRRENRVFSWLLREGKAVEIHCDETEEENILGSVYIGKVKNVAANIEAAFVEIAPGATCYLPVKETEDAVYTKKGSSSRIQAGDELLVQVSREGIKSKFPAVTTNVTLYGKYVLLTTGDTRNSVSSRLSGEERERLLSFAGKWPKTGKYGWLFRTNAGAVEEKLLLGDMERLSVQYEKLMERARYRTCYSRLISVPPAYLKRLSDLYDGLADKIVTDDEGLYREITDYLGAYQPEDLEKAELYEDPLLPLHKLYSLEHQLSQALQEKVWLNSGGYLLIQPTEALTAIDVNTGKYEGGKKKEAAFLKINCEAAVEIARQLRLRNISGIIIVDFINMEERESERRLLSLLEQELKKDPIRTSLVDMTKLSLVEITRMKKEKPLRDKIRN